MTKKLKYESLVENQAINGHVLKKGAVLEMTEEEVRVQQNGGLFFGKVDDGDKRKVYDHTKPAQGEDTKDEDKPGRNDGHEDSDGQRGGIPPGQKPSERDAHAGGNGPVEFRE